MDEFFAAVEKLDNPALRGKAILVGGDPTARGVVSTASYEARAFGCHSAMPMATAVRLCRDAIVLPVRGQRYRQISEQVFEIFERFTPLIEPLSIDEAFLDVSGCERLFGPAEQIAAHIRQCIRQEVHLTASVGVAPNMFLAKLASDLDKPDGLTVIAPENVHSVLDPLPIRKLWGVGPAAAKEFERLGIRTIGRLRRAPPKLIEDTFGQAGGHLLRLACGSDDRGVTPDTQAKSIGQERTFPVDLAEPHELRRVLLQQVEQVARRLRRHGLQGRTVTLKLRYGDFTTLTRSVTLPTPTDVTDELWLAAAGLLAKWQDQHFRPLRLLGVAASQLSCGAGQLALFPDLARQKRRRLDKAVDQITRRFGDGAVGRGGTTK